jgi:cobalt-zinc-cadmium efflux system outer membrane protein
LSSHALQATRLDAVAEARTGSTSVKIAIKAVVWAATVSSLPVVAFAQDPPACASHVTRDNLVRCALSASLLVSAEQREVEAATARRLAVSALLPANPVLSLAGARRSIPRAADSFDWDATLSQEFEVAGQRAVRRDAARAEITAQEKRVSLARREVAASAWQAFFEVLSAREEQRLTSNLMAATQTLATAARARADNGLIPPIESDVADASAVRVLQAKFAATRRLKTAETLLVSLLGLDAARTNVEVQGDLVPIAGLEHLAASRMTKATTERPEVLALQAEQRALQLRANAYRRARIPNPTLSIFAREDGFNERVVGLGVSLPIPLPGNIGHTYLGEIAEAEALAQRVGTDRERIQRALRLEFMTALQAYDSRKQEIEAFTPEKLARAEESLRALGQAVEAGRLSVRDAVVAQQALIEFLQANLAARRAVCLASVELARAASLPLEGNSP